eukprot:756547-Hanusia_phi.AAC.1
MRRGRGHMEGKETREKEGGGEGEGWERGWRRRKFRRRQWMRKGRRGGELWDQEKENKNLGALVLEG